MKIGDLDLREESNLDLIYLIRHIWQRKILILMSALLCMVAFIVISLFVLTPKYRSTTKIYIVNQNSSSNTITAQDLQLGNLLIKDYQEIILSDSVLSSSANDLDLTLNDLRKSIKISTPRDNRILSITAINKDPELASTIANKVREKSIDKIKEITKVKDITTIDEAKTPLNPYTPNVKKNGVIGLLVGFLISILVLVMKEILDDRIRYPEDVEEFLGVTLLGVIPKTNMKRKKNGNN